MLASLYARRLQLTLRCFTGNLHGAFYAQFDLFIDSLQAFIDSHKIYATGLIAQLRAQ